MDIHKISTKVAEDIVKALNVLTYSPAIAARILTNAPGPIQHRLYLTIRAVIKMWAIDYRNRTYHSDYRDMYSWAERHDDD